MDKYRWFLIMLMLCLLPTTAFANSSWHWLSETRPYDLLPIVAAITVLIETAALWFALGKKHLGRVAVIVVIANLLSFAAPYLWMYGEMHMEAIKPFSWLMNDGHYYTVGGVFLVMTLLIETPVTCLALRKHTPKRLLLWLTAIGANVVTTIITAAVERICCYGRW